MISNMLAIDDTPYSGFRIHPQIAMAAKLQQLHTRRRVHLKKVPNVQWKAWEKMAI